MREGLEKEVTGRNACSNKKGVTMGNHYQTEQEIEAVVAGFEQCTTGKDEFTHLSHLTVAVYYLRHSTPDGAFQKMRSGLLRFLDHHGVGRTKYKEQLTRSWITLVQSVIEQMGRDLSLLAATNAVLERLGDLRIPFENDHEIYGTGSVWNRHEGSNSTECWPQGRATVSTSGTRQNHYRTERGSAGC